MYWYILYCQSSKIEKLCSMFRNKGINAFIPKMETYLRTKGKLTNVMFPGYLFIKSDMEQLEFNAYLDSLDYQKDGLIRELKYTNDDSLDYEFVSALTDKEIMMFDKLLDERGYLKLSKVRFINNSPIIYEGPLINFNNNIKKLNIHDGLATLNIAFEGQNIVAGIRLNKD